METADLSEIEGRTYPAGRKTQNLVGGSSPIQGRNFAMGYVTLEPGGGQVPWHAHQQEEVYFVLEGTTQMCLGDELAELRAGQCVYIPPGLHHQITNLTSQPARIIYCYAPPGDVDHWKQELAGTLPAPGKGAPPLPKGAHPQCTKKRT